MGDVGIHKDALKVYSEGQREFFRCRGIRKLGLTVTLASAQV